MVEVADLGVLSLAEETTKEKVTEVEVAVDMEVLAMGLVVVMEVAMKVGPRIMVQVLSVHGIKLEKCFLFFFEHDI